MSSSSSLLTQPFEVVSPDVVYTPDHITSTYTYTTNVVDGTKVIPQRSVYEFKTERAVPKLGLMLVGWGGNNGTTITAGILANKHKIDWDTKEGPRSADFLGSITQSSTIRIGNDMAGNPVYVPFKNLLPTVNPCDLVIGGWDIRSISYYLLEEILVFHFCTSLLSTSFVTTSMRAVATI